MNAAMRPNMKRSNPVFFSASDAIHQKHPSTAMMGSTQSFLLGTRHDDVADDRGVVAQ